MKQLYTQELGAKTDGERVCNNAESLSLTPIWDSSAKRIQAVFISDLHLHPQAPHILKRFEQFIAWAKNQTETVYILGDFLHVWPGDDALDEWSAQIAHLVAQLHQANVKCYFMPGNRDFLLGSHFANLAKWEVLPDPCVINLGEMQILLSHGDQYCTADQSHQWFRWLTRRPSFIWCFTQLPLWLRRRWVEQVREYSQARHQHQQIDVMDVVEESVLNQMMKFNISLLIHGHTHRPFIHEIHYLAHPYTRYVLSDWDDNPQALCYYKPNRIEFNFI
jgi:UDP-2,3-diacylglucosamine hydrolase